MPKYIKEIPEYIPGIQPWRPNLQLYQSVLTRRQQQFNAGQEKVNSLYDSIFNADLTRPDDIKKRDEYLKLADNEIKRLSTVDLSNPANRKAAYSIFKPFYEDDNIMHDIGYTKQVRQAYQEAEAAKKCTGEDCPQFWNGALRYINYKQEEYAQSSDEEALKMSPPRFIAAQNISKDGLDLIKDAKLETKYPEFSEDGKWMYTVKNGEMFIPTVNSFLQSTLGSDPKYLDYYNAQAYLNKKDWMAQNAMKYPNKQAAEERYAREVLDNSWDVYTDEQMQNNVTSGILDHKKFTMEDWLAQGNTPLPSDIKEIESTDAQKQIVDAENRRLENIKFLHDAYKINVNDPSTYTDIIEQINANNLLTGDIYNVAESYAMGTKEITGFKANPYKLAEIKHNYKMEENGLKELIKTLKKLDKLAKKEEKAEQREKDNQEVGGSNEKLDVGKDETGGSVDKVYDTPAQESSAVIKDENQVIENNKNELQNITNISLNALLNAIKNDTENAPFFANALVDNAFEDIFSSLNVIPDHQHPAYNSSNQFLSKDAIAGTLYYHHSKNPDEPGYWDNKPFNEYDEKIHQQKAIADGKKIGKYHANSVYGLTKDVITGSGNILRDFNGNAELKTQAPYGFLSKIWSKEKRDFVDRPIPSILEELEDSRALIDIENSKNTKILNALNKLLKTVNIDPLRLSTKSSNKNLINLEINDDGSGIATYNENDDIYNVNITKERVDQIRANENKYTGKPTPSALFRKKLELQNWLTSKERTPVEIKQFYIDFENAFKTFDLDDVYWDRSSAIPIKTTLPNMDALGNSMLGEGNNYSLLKMFSEILGTSEKGRTKMAEKYGILPIGYLNGQSGTTYEQIRTLLNNDMKEINKLMTSQNNLADRRYEELINYNDLFLKNIGNPNPKNANNERWTENKDRAIWKNLSKLFLPDVNGKPSLYPVSKEEFIKMYVIEALKGVDGWLEVSPSNPSDWFDADVNYNIEGAPNYDDKLPSGPGPSFIGYGGYWRQPSDSFFSDDDGWEYEKIGFTKWFMNDRRKENPGMQAWEYETESIFQMGIYHDANLAYKTLLNNYLDMYYKSASYPKIGVTAYNTAPGLEEYGGGVTSISKPIIDQDVKNNEIYSEAFTYGKQFIDKFLSLRNTDDEAVIKNGINEDYTIEYGNKTEGSINANDMLMLFKSDFFDPSDVVIKYDDDNIPYQSGPLFDAKGVLKDEADFSSSIKFEKLKDGSLKMTMIPSLELRNKAEYKGQSLKNVYQNKAAIESGIVITIPKRKIQELAVNKVFEGQTLNNGLALGFEINDFANTAGIISVEKVTFNEDEGKWVGPAWITPNGIRNNKINGEPEYFKMQPQEYGSEISYRSASELYDALYERLQKDDAQLRVIMNEAIELYKNGLDINGQPLNIQNNVAK